MTLLKKYQIGRTFMQIGCLGLLIGAALAIVFHTELWIVMAVYGVAWIGITSALITMWRRGDKHGQQKMLGKYMRSMALYAAAILVTLNLYSNFL